MLSFENKKPKQQLYILIKTFFIHISLKDDILKKKERKVLNGKKTNKEKR